MDLTLTTRVLGHATVVAVAGEIDVYTAPELRARFIELIDAGAHHLVVDLDEVGFMDSTGLSVLVGVLARLRPHEGSLRVVCAQERVLQLFRITGLTAVFPIHPDFAEAAEAAAAVCEPGSEHSCSAARESGAADVLR